MKRENPTEPVERQEQTTGEHPALVVPRSFSFEVVPDVADRVIERTKKYLEKRATEKNAEDE